jgi:1,4-alpha-glucan branching enzyme
MWGHPGKKLLFMGGEFGQWREWAHEGELSWDLLAHAPHAGLARWVADLNAAHRAEPALHERDFAADGFEWIDSHDAEASVLAFLRRSRDGAPVLVVCNFTPVPRTNYAVGVPEGGRWQEILNSDAPVYGGSGIGNLGGVEAAPVPAHGRFHSLVITLPPLAVVMFKPGVA